MLDNVGETAYGSRNPAKGPLENLVAFKPDEGLEPSKKHDFRLQIPFYESAVVPPEEKQPSPEPFVFNFDVPVHAVHVVDINQKATAKGVTLRLDRVINSPGGPPGGLLLRRRRLSPQTKRKAGVCEGALIH